jgi:hypothetical protein
MILHGFNNYYQAFPTPQCLDVMLRCGRWICPNVDPEGTWGKYNFNNLHRIYNSEVSASIAELFDITNEPPCAAYW